MTSALAAAARSGDGVGPPLVPSSTSTLPLAGKGAGDAGSDGAVSSFGARRSAAPSWLVTLSVAAASAMRSTWRREERGEAADMTAPVEAGKRMCQAGRGTAPD